MLVRRILPLAPSVPEASPQNISTPKSTPNGITLSWKPPDSTKQNGNIIGYRILLFDTLRNTSYNKTVNSSVANFHNLMPYTPYVARVVAFTRKGPSNASDPVQVKTQEAGQWH